MSILTPHFLRIQPGGGGSSSIVKVPGVVPPARVYFFELSSLAKGILFANCSPVGLGKGMHFGNFGQEMSKFGNSCKEAQLFSNFSPDNAQIW